jgi:hypothetical protein
MGRNSKVNGGEAASLGGRLRGRFRSVSVQPAQQRVVPLTHLFADSKHNLAAMPVHYQHRTVPSCERGVWDRFHLPIFLLSANIDAVSTA